MTYIRDKILVKGQNYYENYIDYVGLISLPLLLI